MQDEFKISVYDIMQTPRPESRTSEDGSPAGDTIRKLINDNWNQHEKIVISFEGIVRMARTFMDEAFAKLLDDHTLQEINEKVFFPDAKEYIVKDLNSAFKLRKKINAAKQERESSL